MKPAHEVMKIYRPHNTVVIHIFAKFGGPSPSLAIATQSVWHILSVVATAFRPTKCQSRTTTVKNEIQAPSLSFFANPISSARVRKSKNLFDFRVFTVNNKLLQLCTYLRIMYIKTCSCFCSSIKGSYFWQKSFQTVWKYLCWINSRQKLTASCKNINAEKYNILLLL